MKHHDLNQYYHSNNGPKAKYTTFIARVNRYGIDKEIAIKRYVKLQGRHKIKSHIGDDGRVCVKCGEYKKRDLFARSVTGHKLHTSSCKDCRNEYKRQFRQSTQSSKDKEYKLKSRKLKVGEILHFGIQYQHGLSMDIELRKVVDKKPNQAYKLQSLSTGYFCRLDTTEGNLNYKKFYRYYNNQCILLQLS